jgi:hypothetical protein
MKLAKLLNKRLWKIGDIVDVLEAFENLKGRRMRYTAQQCLDRARECEWMASQAKDRDAKAAFVELAQQWQELARQTKELERDRSKLP